MAIRPLLLLVALWITAAVPGYAQDPVKVDPKHYKVELENEQVLVLASATDRARNR